MRGFGLFMVGFMVGYAAWLLAMVMTRSASTRLRLYGPLLPFALGLWAMLPYAVQVAYGLPAADLQQPIWHLFLFFPLLNASLGLRAITGNVEFDVGVMALAYLHLLVHYIRLVKSARRPYAE